MPGHDDTLNAGGPEGDPMAELCTCGHVLGVHHTLDEACCEDGCECCAFQRMNSEFGNGQPTEEQIQAQLDAHSQQIAENVRDLTADLPGGEGRIGEIKNELDQILDAAQLCSDTSCGHRRDRHKHDGCNDCECPTFLDALEVPTFLGAAWTGTRKSSTHSNTREAVDRLMTEEHRKIGTPGQTHDDRARAMDAEAMSPTEAMTDEERTESDAVQAETLDNLCTCGHRYGDHWVDDQCSRPGCECDVFEALLKLHDDPTFLPDDVRPTDEQVAAFVTGREPVDLTRAANEAALPLLNTCCLKCGHEAEDHAANGTVCHVKGCDCEALVEYTGGIDHEALERDRRLPYTPPLLRKKYIGEAELRKVLIDAGRLDLLQQLPQVDRVTTNYGAEHWQEIERLARNPQGSSETARPESERTITAIATALLELRQCLGATYTNSDALMQAIKKNAEVVDKTVETLELMSARLLPFVAKVLRDEGEGK